MPLIKSLSFRGLGLEFPGISEAASLAGDAGFQALDLPLRDLFEQKVDPTTIKSILSDFGLQAGACPFPFDWRSSRQSFQHTMNLLPEFLKFLTSTGVNRLYTRVSESIEIGQNAEETIQWHSERLTQIANLLETNEIKLGLETVGVKSFRQGKNDLMPTLKLVRKKMAELFQKQNNIGLLVDIFHLHASDEKLQEAISSFENRIVGIHIADLPDLIDRDQILDHVRALPNSKRVINIKNYLDQMNLLGVDAPVMIETVRCDFARNEMDLSKIIHKVANSFNQVFPD